MTTSFSYIFRTYVNEIVEDSLSQQIPHIKARILGSGKSLERVGVMPSLFLQHPTHAQKVKELLALRVDTYRNILSLKKINDNCSVFEIALSSKKKEDSTDSCSEKSYMRFKDLNLISFMQSYHLHRRRIVVSSCPILCRSTQEFHEY